MTDPEQTNDARKAVTETATQEVTAQQESPVTEEELPTDEDILREAIDATLMYPQVSGIGTERGILEGLLEKQLSGTSASEEDLDFARLVTRRAREMTLSYMS